MQTKTINLIQNDDDLVVHDGLAINMDQLEWEPLEQNIDNQKES